MGFGMEILFALMLGLLILGPKQLHTMLAHVARAKAQLENATRGLNAQLGPELDAAPEAGKTDCSHGPVGDSPLCSTFESAPEFPGPAKDALVGS